MSKKEKLFIRFNALPSPVDFTWENYVTLMKHFNFNVVCASSGSSHFIFEHISGYKFTTSKTHPGGVLKNYQFKNAKTALNETGEWNYDE